MILEREDFNRRNVTWVLGGLSVIVAGVFLYPKIESRYRRWKHGGTLEQIRKFSAENDASNTLLAIKAALSQEPSDPVVWRMAADFLDQLGDPEAVRMRQQVVQLEPDAAENRLALARTALHFKDVVTARQALENVQPAQRHSSAYRRLAAALAVVTDNPAQAAALLTTAVLNDPGNAELRLERASLSLRYGSAAVIASALGEMKALADRPETRGPALRELAAASLRAKDYDGALAYAQELTKPSTPEFIDLLLRANILLSAGKSTLEAVLPALQAHATTNTTAVAELAGWLSAMNRADLASSWLHSLPADVQELPVVRHARTNNLLALRQWESARALIAAGAYGHINSEALQLAFAARVLRDHDRPALQNSTWEEAIRLTASDLGGLRVLHRLTLEWRWGAELNAVLLAIATKHPGEAWAYQALADRYHRALDTSNLKSIYSLWQQAHPAETFVEGNAVFLKLLTEPSKTASPSKIRAAELHETEPDNAFFATTHAFALWQMGRYPQARAVVDRLPELERRLPSRALYIALVLNSAGSKAQAAEYLSLVRPDDLLPEERELLRSLKPPPAPPRAAVKEKR